MKSKPAWQSWPGCVGKEATHDSRAWFPGSFRGVRELVGLGEKSRFVLLPQADGGDSATLFPYVGGGGEVAVGTGAGIFSQQGHLIQRFQFRGRGDFRARRGT